jgi:hypothetical protein
MSEVILEWTPADALHLQRALRMTNEAFAERLGAAVRTVAKWHANAEMTLKLEMQQALDVLLEQSPDAAQERFWAWRERAVESRDADIGEWRSRLAQAQHLHGPLAWLRAYAEDDATLEETVAAHAARLRADQVPQRGHVDDADPGRTGVEHLQQFYREGVGRHAFLEVVLDGRPLSTSMLTTSQWLGARAELADDDGRFGYDPTPPPILRPEVGSVAAATRRLGEILAHETRFIDGELYRLTRVDVGPAGIEADFAIGSFAQYALTWDLLETELVHAGPDDDLPLREQLLPDIRSILTPASRLCMGGVLALTAFARPATKRRRRTTRC